MSLLFDSPWQTRFHLRHADERRQVMARLLCAGEAGSGFCQKLASKVGACGQYPTCWAKPDGRLVVTSARCKSRICPTCGPLRVRELEDRVRAAVKEIDDARLITLTLTSSNQPLADQLNRIRKCFSKLRRCAEWKKHVRGGVYTVEVTWSNARQQWHPHLHVVADGVFWSQKSISACWLKATGDSSIVDIRRVPSREALVRYVAKYVSKTQDPSGIPASRWIEWVEQTHGLRLCSTFGTLHGSKPGAGDEEAGGPCVHVASVAGLYEDSMRGSLRASRLLRAVGFLQSVNRSSSQVDKRNLSVRRRLEFWDDNRPDGLPPPRERPRWVQMPLLGVDYERHRC